MRLVPKNDLTPDGKSTSASSRSPLLDRLFFLIGFRRPCNDKKVIYDTDANLLITLITFNLDASGSPVLACKTFLIMKPAREELNCPLLCIMLQGEKNEFMSVVYSYPKPRNTFRPITCLNFRFWTHWIFQVCSFISYFLAFVTFIL
jgi:hypothetical protein